MNCKKPRKNVKFDLGSFRKFGKSKDDDRKSESYTLFHYGLYESLAFFFVLLKNEYWRGNIMSIPQ